ncbi:uncharacterized protein [Drosophila pseudoobscura]|uniref:Uncharacterized protein n=1 Tax=Drosophila pseudoobscura pseudoobscura TaxID=46245 RepID=A0A6I8USZ2_DROPS|nr:uncharacterized protein LOC4803765 [Drosophila pseudoobscura]
MDCNNNNKAPHLSIPVMQGAGSHLTTTESAVQVALHNLVVMDESVEGTVLGVLLSAEKKYRLTFDTFKKEMELQAIAASTLWELIQRYKIAMEVDADCKCTQLYAVEPKEETIQKYYIHYQVIVSSNKSLWRQIESLRSYVLAFRRECKNLNLEEQTPFIQGDAFHKPIKFFIELVDELFNYFFSLHLKLDCAARQLDPMDLESLEEYQKLLKPNEDFEEYFLYNLSYCQCLRMPPKCPETRVYTNIENAAMKKEAMEQAKRARCDQRVNRMTLRASQMRESAENPPSVTQDTELAPNPDAPPESGNATSDPLSAKFERQLISERHTRQLVNQVHNALSQS